MTDIGIRVETYPLDGGTWGFDVIDALTGDVLLAECGYGSEAHAARQGKAAVADKILDNTFPDLYLVMTQEIAVQNPMKGVPGGSVAACIAEMSTRPSVDDPGALCAWIARQRGEKIPRRKK